MSAETRHLGLTVSATVWEALEQNKPVVALESTVIAHGLPYPENLGLAHELEQLVAARGAVPATIGIIEGRPKVGLSEDDLVRLASSSKVRKVSPRDIPIAVGAGLDGATTVGGTMALAHRVGIRVMSTGGIGGIHRGGELSLDISPDLPAIATTPMALVCSGPKTLIDPARTLEWLETHGVPVVGYETNTLPLFYVAQSNLPINHRAGSPRELATMLEAGCSLGLRTALLITRPVPAAQALDPTEIGKAMDEAQKQALDLGIKGYELTPFILARLRDLTKGRTLAANMALLKSNASLAADVAIALASPSAGRAA